MKGSSVYKIPEGKLVKISLEFEKQKILSVKIFGDFFVYPEEGLEKIEKELKGKNLEEKEIVQAVENARQKHSLEFFGLNAQGIATAVLMAKSAGGV